MESTWEHNARIDDDPLNRDTVGELCDLLGAGFDDLIATYRHDAEADFEALLRAVDAGDAADVGQRAHSLRSSSANIGACALATLAGQLEKLSRCGTLPPVLMLRAVRAEFERVLGALRTLQTDRRTQRAVTR